MPLDDTITTEKQIYRLKAVPPFMEIIDYKFVKIPIA